MPKLATQVSECADINAIRSNNLTYFNCKSPDHLVKDCPEPNKMQQPQSNNRKNSSMESAIEAPTQTLKSLFSKQKSHGNSKPKQPFNHKRANPHAKPSFKPTYRPHNNKGQYFKNNSKYQKQTAHTNAIENYEAMYLNMCENFRAKIPKGKPIPLFSLDKFNSQWLDNGNLTLALDHGLWFWKLIICDLFELFNHLFICANCVTYPVILYFESDLHYLFGSFNILHEA